MSAKYQRVKQADLQLPAPLRWLTRAFSSITLAVCLLTLVVVYGVIASVPIGMLATGALLTLVVVGQGGTSLLGAYLLGRKAFEQQQTVRRIGLGAVSVVVIAFGVLLCVVGVRVVLQWTSSHPWFTLHQATVIYRLPWLEMTELEFYSWWPMKVILGLFVVNMVWATIRRIEFKFVNIGVLTVHTGIVTMAFGSIVYGTLKIEGDTLLWRRDLGGKAVNYFYDQTDPAIYFLDHQGAPLLMLGLHDLPRYNDTDPDTGGLDIQLHKVPAFREVFGERVRATINGLISYGNLEKRWVEAPARGEGLVDELNPGLRLQFGDNQGPRGGQELMLLAAVPGRRVVEQPSWSVEHLVSPTPKRIEDLQAKFDGQHGLIVEVPGQGFRQVYAIQKGQTIDAGSTGYKLTIESIGAYPMGFASKGYEGAKDTQATIQVEGAGKSFRRISLFRYPERTQDFVPAPGDPNVGPMGKRQDPAPQIQLTYIDMSKLRFWLIAEKADSEKLKLLARSPEGDQAYIDLPEPRVPIPGPGNEPGWLYLTERLVNASQVPQPVATPKSQRQPKDEGTYIHALLPVDLEVDLANGDPWKTRVWLAHMRYPEYPDGVHVPVKVDLPVGSGGTQPIYLAFSRVRRELPFAMAMDGFQMQPYKGTQIPRDYVADLSIMDLDVDGRPAGLAQQGQTRLNNPLIHQGIKLSQTGWDPGDRNDPNHQARDEQGRFINQQRYSIIGIGNNVGIRAIFIGACLVVVGIPWAFYIKPMLLRKKSQKLRQEAACATEGITAKTAA